MALERYEPNKRPGPFPDQVMDPYEIEIGQRYFLVFRGRKSDDFIASSGPYQDLKHRIFWIDVLDSRDFRSRSISLADSGVVPYPKAGWTNWYHMVRVNHPHALSE